MKIAITGALGFIGHELVQRMLDDGHEVIAVDFYERLIPLYEKNQMPIMQELYGSLPRCVALREPWEFLGEIEKFGPHVVVHAGAVVNTKDLGSYDLFRLNVTYTEELTKACDRAGAHIVFFSSAAVYGNTGRPNNPYGLTKALGENIVARSRTKTASLRLFNVFGKNEQHKGEMASVPWKIAATRGGTNRFKLHSLSSRRDFVPSTAVVEAVRNVAINMMGPGQKMHEVYDVGTGTATSFAELADMLGVSIEIIDIPPELVGRYQDYTCAGIGGVRNIGIGMSTKEGLGAAYGLD